MSLLDPSAAMLARIRDKAIHWPFETAIQHGDIDTLDTQPLYDVVTVNSVLHHVVELEAFLSKVQGLIKPGGLLLTAQDPRAQHKIRSDVILRGRRLKKQIAFWDIRGWIRESTKASKTRWKTMKYVRRVFGKEVPLSPMAMQASTTLLENRIIRIPMDQASLYAVTDVHVSGHPMKSAKGIDDADLKHWLPAMNLLARYTYRFRDADFDQLTKFQQEEEISWWQDNDPHGATVALVFQKAT